MNQIANDHANDQTTLKRGGRSPFSARTTGQRNRSKDHRRRGSILLIVLVLIVVLLGVGLTLADVTCRELVNSHTGWEREQARTAADAGLDYAVWYLSNNKGAWPPPNTDPSVSQTGSYTATMLTSGAIYTVTVGAPPARWAVNGNIALTSTAYKGRETVTAFAICQPTGDNVNVWTNAIFAADAQASGEGFHGNSTVAGGIHIRGDDITNPNTIILQGNGNGGIYNNYVDAGGDTSSGSFPGPLVPSAEITAGSGSPHDLKAHFRVREGMVNLGNKVIGQNPATNAGDKGPFAGAFMGTAPGPTGLADIQSSAPVTDAGQVGPYDLSQNAVVFPDLVNPISVTFNHSGTLTTVTYNDYFALLNGSDPVTGKPNAYMYTANGGNLNVTGANLTIQDPQNANNSLVVSGGVMTVSGIIWAQGTVSISGVTYKGSGLIVSGGQASGSGGVAGGETVVNGKDITVSNLLPNGNYDGAGGHNGFPNNVLGLVSMNNLNIGSKNHDTSIFAGFAEAQSGSSQAQNQFAGSMVAKTFYIFNNNHIFFVPELPNHLPWGLPGAQPIPVVTGEKMLNYRLTSLNYQN